MSRLNLPRRLLPTSRPSSSLPLDNSSNPSRHTHTSPFFSPLRCTRRLFSSFPGLYSACILLLGLLCSCFPLFLVFEISSSPCGATLLSLLFASSPVWALLLLSLMAFFVIEKEDCLSAEMVQVVHWSLQLRAIPSSEAEVKVACMGLEACRRAKSQENLRLLECRRLSFPCERRLVRHCRVDIVSNVQASESLEERCVKPEEREIRSRFASQPTFVLLLFYRSLPSDCT